ncbi:MAG TPA: oligosaccharide flippase family protein [Ktedonobacteraceae bacterium]
MSSLLYRWMKTNGVLLFNAASLVATFVVKSGLGFAYWWLVARRFSPEAVGFASAAISAMTLLGTLCMLGLGTLLIRELPRQPGKEASLISAALILVGVIGGCIGLLFALGVPSLSADLQSLRASIQAVALFSVGVGLATVNLVLDQVLIGLLRGDLQLWRNSLFAGLKLAALTVAGFWLVQRGGLTIYATWALADALSLAALAGFAIWKGKWTGRIVVPRWGLLRKLGPSAMQHHLLNLLLIGPNFALPVLVTVLISARVNAWFYISFLIADVAYVVPQALVTALYAVSSAQPNALARKARLTIGLALISCLFANGVLLFGSKQLLGLFGPSYTEQGIESLRLLALGAIPFLVKDLYVAISRIHDRIAKALLPLASGAVLELGTAALGGRLGGLIGVSLGWLVAVCIEAMLMSGLVYKIIRPTPGRENLCWQHDPKSIPSRSHVPSTASKPLPIAPSQK